MQGFLDIFDIYVLEAVINGIMLGGVLALLALGLNLIFGVIDVTWICYAELVMIGMYAMYFLVQYFGLPYYAAAPLTILLVAALGALLHLLVIAPLLTAPPINQLLATGGVLFILQSFATVAFGIDFRNLGIRLPVLAIGEMHFSYSRLLAFVAALLGMLAIYFFMKRTYTGTAIRAVAQDEEGLRLMGANPVRIKQFAFGIATAVLGIAGALLIIVAPVDPTLDRLYIGRTFCVVVMAGLGSITGTLIASIILGVAETIVLTMFGASWAPAISFALLLGVLAVRPQGLFGR